MSKLGRRIRNWVLTLVAVVVIGLAVLLGLFRLAASQLPEYRAQLEARASEAAGLPVRFGSIDARLHLHGPELIIRDARVLDPKSGQVLIRAQTGGVSLDLWALVRDQSLVVSRVFLDGARLRIDRAPDGRFHIHGLDTGSVGGDTGLDLADLPEGLFELRRTTVSVEDGKSDFGPWSFSDVAIRLNNDGDQVKLDGSVDLPAELGGQLTLSAELSGPQDAVGERRWEAHVQADDIRLQGWSGLVPKRLRLIEKGNGALTLRVFAAGQTIEHASLKADINNLRIFQAPGSVASIAYDNLSGRFEFDRSDEQWVAAAHDFRLDQAGKVWLPGDIWLAMRRDEGADGMVSSLSMTAEYFQLDQLATLAGWIPDEALRQRLKDLNPRGSLRDASADIERDADRVVGYQISARFEDVALDPGDDFPGFSGATGQVEADQGSGTLRLAGDPVVVEIPSVFRWPLEFDRLDGEIDWTLKEDGFVVRTDRIQLDRGPIRIDVEAELKQQETSPLNLELTGTIKDAPFADIDPYLPVSIMSENLKNFLDNAFVSGTMPRADVHIDGPIGKFPFRANEGIFTADFLIEGMTLDYADGWPAIQDINGRARFDRISLTVDLENGEVLGNRTSNAKVGFENLDEAVMHLNADVSGDLGAGWEYVRQSGLARLFGGATELLTISGTRQMSVDLTLPVRTPDQVAVRLDIDVTDGQLAIAGLSPEFTEINGSILVNNEVINASGLTAQFMNYPVEVDIVPRVGSERTEAIIRGVGRVNGPDLALLGVPWADRAAGSADYRASAMLPTRGGGNVRLQVLTDLEGIEFDWPEPLNKDAAPRELSVDIELLPDNLMDLGIAYAPDIDAMLRLEHETGEPWTVYTGMVTTSGDAKLPEDQGLMVSGQVARSELESWLAATSSDDSAGQFDLRGLLREVSISIDSAQALGYDFSNVDLLMQRGVEGWAVQLDGEMIAGHIELPYAIDSGPIVANLQRAYLTDPVESTAPDGTVQSRPDPDPRELPSAVVSVDDFRLSDMRLGKLTTTLAHDEDGTVANDILFVSEPLEISGNASWLMTPDGPQTQVDLLMTSDDLTAALDNLNLAESMSAASGKVSAQVYWDGAPNGEFLSRISGNVRIDIRDGALEDVKPGAGRLVGLLSVAQLTRRLSLDFQDVFGKGLAFDSLSGDFVLEEGRAYTNNLTLDGPAALIALIGWTGLENRDYDQTAVVNASFGNTLPVVGALAAGPAVGAAVFVLSKIFQKPLNQMSQAYYRITGSWDDPTIVPITGDFELAEAPAAGSP